MEKKGKNVQKKQGKSDKKKKGLKGQVKWRVPKSVKNSNLEK